MCNLDRGDRGSRREGGSSRAEGVAGASDTSGCVSAGPEILLAPSDFRDFPCIVQFSGRRNRSSSSSQSLNKSVRCKDINLWKGPVDSELAISLILTILDSFRNLIEPGSEGSPGMKKPSIMLIEDEFIIATDIKERLENLGYDVCAPGGYC